MAKKNTATKKTSTNNSKIDKEVKVEEVINDVVEVNVEEEKELINEVSEPQTDVIEEKAEETIIESEVKSDENLSNVIEETKDEEVIVENKNNVSNRVDRTFGYTWNGVEIDW